MGTLRSLFCFPSCCGAAEAFERQNGDETRSGRSVVALVLVLSIHKHLWQDYTPTWAISCANVGSAYSTNVS